MDEFIELMGSEDGNMSNKFGIQFPKFLSVNYCRNLLNLTWSTGLEEEKHDMKWSWSQVFTQGKLDLFSVLTY